MAAEVAVEAGDAAQGNEVLCSTHGEPIGAAHADTVVRRIARVIEVAHGLDAAGDDRLRHIGMDAPLQIRNAVTIEVDEAGATTSSTTTATRGRGGG